MPDGIVWLASYPKSGNTWMRAMLTAYRELDGVPASTDLTTGPLAGLDLDSIGISSSMGMLERAAGLEVELLHDDELDLLRPDCYRQLVERPYPEMKVHDRQRRVGTEDLFPSDCTVGSILLVRDPRDVALSLAPFMGKPIEWAVEFLNDPDAALSAASRGGGVRRRWSHQCRQVLGDWSTHVQSWFEMDALVLRYEDTLRDPEAALARVLPVVGEVVDPDRVAAAVAATSFDRLRALEDQVGFKEGSIRAERFFRRGVAGQWRDELSAAHVAAIEAAHGPMMHRLGYALENSDLATSPPG